MIENLPPIYYQELGTSLHTDQETTNKALEVISSDYRCLINKQIASLIAELVRLGLWVTLRQIRRSLPDEILKALDNAGHDSPTIKNAVDLDKQWDGLTRAEKIAALTGINRCPK